MMVATQHPKRAVRLMKKMKPVPTVKPLDMGKAQMAEGLTVKALVVMVSLQMWLTQRKTMMGKPKDSAVRLKESDVEGGSSSSETDGEIPTRAATLVKETKGGTLMKEARGGNPSSCQTLSLPNLDSKDTEEEWKVQQHKDAPLLDRNFGEWCDRMISKGHTEWNKHDTMICDHKDPGKEAKFPDPTSLPLDYMKHCGVFKSKKTNKYDLCHFYQVGLLGALPNFPYLHKPATHELLGKCLLKARELGHPNLVVVFVWDSAMAVCLLQEQHIKDSLRHLLMEPQGGCW